METPDPQTRLDALADEIIEKKICAHLAAQPARLVMGEGRPDADIVIIGEAPGAKEDKTGLPFQGAAGKFLNEMLASADMDRGDVYITNVVKYRPPKNRDPSEAEKAEFAPYLTRQLDIIEPKVVVTLGSHAMKHFMPDAAIGDVHGQPTRVRVQGRDLTVMPLYHPAFALYNGSNRQMLIDDFLKVPGVVRAAAQASKS